LHDTLLVRRLPTRKTPPASRSGSRRARVSSGTMRMPPPSPRIDPNAPAATPPASISSPTSMSAGSRALVSRAQLRAQVLRGVREQGDVPRSLQGHGKLALVACACAGLASRLDLCPLRQVAAEAVDLLVVDLDGLVGTEGADLPATSVAVEVVALAGLGGRHRIRSPGRGRKSGFSGWCRI